MGNAARGHLPSRTVKGPARIALAGAREFRGKVPRLQRVPCSHLTSDAAVAHPNRQRTLARVLPHRTSVGLLLSPLRLLLTCVPFVPPFAGDD